jgi:homoserine kinase
MTATLSAFCGASGLTSHTVVPVSIATSSAVRQWRELNGAITAAKRGATLFPDQSMSDALVRNSRQAGASPQVSHRTDAAGAICTAPILSGPA